MMSIGRNVKMLRMLTTQVRFFRTADVNRVYADVTKIGLREVVGHGMNGQATYVDSKMFPYPAIRFREITPVYKALKEKEKGDWRSLTQDEKKCLYRISYRQTFSEMTAPTGEWKAVLGGVLISLSCGLLLYMFVRLKTDAPLPPTFSDERRITMLKRIIAFRMNPITGISSKWDYEKNTWKK